MFEVQFAAEAGGHRRPAEKWHETDVQTEEVRDLAQQLVAEFRVTHFVNTTDKGVALEIWGQVQLQGENPRWVRQLGG